MRIIGSFEKGCTYNQDGIVRKRGKPIGQWTTQFHRKTIKQSRLVDLTDRHISRVEAIRWGALQAAQTHFDEKWRPAMTALKKVKKAHAKIHHQHDGEKHWWLFLSTGDSYHFDWVDEPKKPVNLSVGQALYDAEMAWQKKAVRRHLPDVLLEFLLVSLIDAMNPEKFTYSPDVRFVINGRNYWYSVEINEHNVLRPRKLHWPEEELTTVEIGDER